MTNVLLAIGIMTGIALFFAVVLTVAWRFLRVAEDPRLEALDEALPGSNCGACGEPGCKAFAVKLLAGAHTPSDCTVNSPEGIEAVAELLGVDAGEATKRVARLACAGGYGQARRLAEYRGFDSCSGAAVLSGGGKSCPWGCLGLADCEVACGFDAISMNRNGLPVVDVLECTACGDCVEACPRDLFHVTPLEHALLVQCSAPLAGEAAMALCAVACDACGRCAQDAPQELIRMVDGLPVVDYAGGGPATPAITARCPTGAIVWAPGQQFPVLERVYA
ncbi:MAG TPA: (Fe-S)-binding protein [Myxococcota bacterium]|nr:(Fe-S)-binding protein [Myxococcota bacterium]